MDDVKSVWPLHPGLHTCYNGRSRGQRHCEVKRIVPDGGTFLLYTECGTIQPEQVTAVQEFNLRNADYEVETEELDGGGYKVLMKQVIGAEELEDEMLKNKITLFATLSDKLEEEMTGKDVI